MPLAHDSRNDPAYCVQYPPGNNGAVRDAAGFAAAIAGLDTYAASSRNAGIGWAPTRLSAAGQMPKNKMFGDRRASFHGEYNYVSSVGSFAMNAWTDTRQMVGGDDPRYPGGEGFDVHSSKTKTTTRSHRGLFDDDAARSLLNKGRVGAAVHFGAGGTPPRPSSGVC